MYLVLSEIFISFLGFELLSSTLLFQPQGLLLSFLVGRSSGSELCQLFSPGDVLISPSFVKDSFAGYKLSVTGF